MQSGTSHIIEKIEVVAFEDHNGVWFAQGVQYDIVARAKSALGLREAFSRQVAANLALNQRFGREGLEGIPPAPEKFRRMFEEAKERLSPTNPRRVGEDMDIRLVEAG
jgi:hypothetical protein